MNRGAITIITLIISTASFYQNIELKYQKSRFSYNFQVEVGTPPQKQVLTIDVQSPDLFLKCDDCSNCKSKIPNYSTKDSSSLQSFPCNDDKILCNSCSKNNSCEVSKDFDFGLGSIHMFGRREKENISFGSNCFNSLEMICVDYTDDTGKNFEDNGIFGLAPHPLKNILFQQMEYGHRIFSLCFDGKMGGYFQIGQNPKGLDRFDSYLQYAGQGFQEYELVGLKSVSFDDNQLAQPSFFSNSKVTLSTLSQFITLPQAQFQQVVRRLHQICKINNQSCAPFSQALQFQACYYIDFQKSEYESRNDYLLNIFTPSLWFLIDDSYYLLSAFQYFIWAQKTQNGGLACLALKPIEVNQYVLGQPFLFWHRMTFLLDEHKIGVKQFANCTYSSDPSTYVQESLRSESGMFKYLVFLCLLVLIGITMHLTNRCQKIRDYVGKGKKNKVEFVEQMEVKSSTLEQS